MKALLKRYIKVVKKSLETERGRESKYYKKLFIENPDWNNPEANNEELLRWQIIEDFLNDINNLKSDLNSLDILDLGCGRGWLTNLLFRYGNVVGIEPVSSVVEYAKKLFPNITFINGTSRDLVKQKDFKKYDLIVTSEVIEHIKDKNKDLFIDDISKLLKHNGFLIVTTPRKEAEPEWKSFMSPNQPIEDWMTEVELEKLISKKSFLKLRLERYSISPMPNTPEIEIYQLWLFQKM